MTIADLSILFRPFGFIAPKTLIYLAFKSFDFERTWWMLLHTWWMLLRTWLMLLRTWWMLLRTWWMLLRTWWMILRTWWMLLRTWWILLRTWWMLLRTWWMLFQKSVVRTKFDIYVFIYYFWCTKCSCVHNCNFHSGVINLINCTGVSN